MRTDSTCSNSSDGIEFSTESPPKQFQLASFCSGSGYSSKSDRESDESDSESDSDDDDDDGEWDELDGDELATIPEELQVSYKLC